MKKKIIIALLLTASITIQSCGVMFGGSRYNGTIVAKNQPNAEIFVDGQRIGTGTATGSFKRNEELVVELRSPGCEPQITTFDKVFRTGNFILSLFTFGLIGIGVDLGTGASYKPDHKHNSAVTKQTTKDFTFNVNGVPCPQP